MWNNIFPVQRPNMAVPVTKKDKKYYGDMGRSFMSGFDQSVFMDLHAKGLRAEAGYNDHVWTQEDIDTFLMDESRESRNRVPFNFNMVRPLVEQYRGSMVQSDYNVSVEPVSMQMRTRRQVALGTRRVLHSIAEMSPEMRRIISKGVPLGEDLAETESIFMNQYQDDYIRAMNHLRERIAAITDRYRFVSDDAFRFACWGLLVEYARGAGSHYSWERVHPMDFFCDTRATMPDLSDTSFKGIRSERSIPSMAEEYNLDMGLLKQMEEVLRAYAPIRSDFSINSNTKVPVFSLFWEDLMHSEFGYVMGPWDVPTLVRVGQDELTTKTGVVTHNDLIDPPDTELNRELFEGKKTRKSAVQCTRFVDFTPWEYLAGLSSNDKPELRNKYAEGALQDLVLDYGVYKLQEYNPYDTAFSRSPIKVTTFARAEGRFVTPVQAVLDPNRFANRILSSVEGQVNNAGSKYAVYDQDLLELDPAEVETYRKKGKAIPMHAKGQGVNNVFGVMDEGPSAAAYNFMQILSSVQDMVRTVTGVHAPLTGEQTKDQLVGVTQILVQRGALMQEPFYAAHNDLQLQKARFDVTAGKEWYMQRPDVLADMVSEDDILALVSSRGFEMERFNAKVVRDNPERTQRQQANLWLDTLLQLGLIDRARYAQLYSKSTIADISVAIQQYNVELQQAEKQAQREQAAQQLQAGLTAMQQQAETEQADALKDASKSEDMMRKEDKKTQSNIARDTNNAALEREKMLLESQLAQAAQNTGAEAVV